MKNKTLFQKAMLAGSAGAALLALNAQAAFNAPRGDLIFGSVEVGASSGFDFVVDLGGNDAFQAYTGVAAVNQNARLLGGSSASASYAGLNFTSENRFAASDVTAVFGDLNNVLFSAFGIDSEASPTVNSTYFMTRNRTDDLAPLTGAGSVAWTRRSAFAQGATGNSLEAPRVTANSGTSLSDTSVKDNANDLNSYNSIIPVAGFSEMENTTGASFGPSSVVRSDLYYVAPGSGASDYLGYFELQGDGDLWFIPENFVPVPEPSTYGLLAGAGMLVLTLKQRMSRKTA